MFSYNGHKKSGLKRLILRGMPFYFIISFIDSFNQVFCEKKIFKIYSMQVLLIFCVVFILHYFGPIPKVLIFFGSLIFYIITLNTPNTKKFRLHEFEEGVSWT